ncbi:hypothetical protein MNBD_GAMMA26-833 [hydrothermal vent metagenome]|uniref:Uncharacterized protein n=1 Tax=hydrothermal vent metagenome TaxID=652676 RepID=A0A3B1BN66_9ZZZZ
MCEFYDPLVSTSCREPIADVVNNKEKANFCGYYKMQLNAYHPPDKTARHTTQSQLADLFGVSAESQDQSTGSAPDPETSAAKAQLASLFGAKNPENL